VTHAHWPCMVASSLVAQCQRNRGGGTRNTFFWHFFVSTILQRTDRYPYGPYLEKKWTLFYRPILKSSFTLKFNSIFGTRYQKKTSGTGNNFIFIFSWLANKFLSNLLIWTNLYIKYMILSGSSPGVTHFLTELFIAIRASQQVSNLKICICK